MRMLLICGHGNGDSGAVGNGYQEQALNRELGKLIQERAVKMGITCDMYDTSRNAYKDCQNGRFKLDKAYNYVFEIHFNAHANATATGSECYVTNCETGISVEQAIMRNMDKFFKLRDNDNIFDGVKKTNFLVISTVKKLGYSGALLETCFISNKEDVAVYQANKKAIAEGIVAGIMEGFGLKEPSTTTPTPPTTSTPSTPSQKVEVGSTLTITGVYKSSTSDEKFTPSKKTGKVTKIVTGAKNPYLLEGGNIGWVRLADVTKIQAPSSSTATKKSVQEVAQEIVKGVGNWGTGATRKKKLTEYGGEKFATDVQNAVNKLLA